MKHLLRFFGGLGAAFVALAGPPVPARAGGWVVVSLDSAPAFRAGEANEVGFTVLRHGVQPETSTDISIVVTGADGSQQSFAAAPEGAEGHHVATLVLAAGDYMWSVEGEYVSYDLGSFGVDSSPAATTWGWDLSKWGGLGAAAAFGGAALGDKWRHRRRAVPAAA